ncbi:hypothetical protein [Hydrogenovibrio halophilus]|uniref:hypothetical protein n=1 Tax=Hydrogenovibrio halophilus TaxID=373391 RepID=UPI00146B2B1A|nr:hypothetical protein [Hydrogenovibrio halophilus]
MNHRLLKQNAIILTLGCLWGLPGLCDEGSKNQEGAPTDAALSEEAAQPDTETPMDVVHAWIGSSVDGVGRTLDRFFGAADEFEQAGGSRLDVTLPFSYETTDGLGSAVDFDARIALPRTEQRWHLWLKSARDPFSAQAGSDADAVASPESARVQVAQPTEERQTSLGFQTFFASNENLISLIDVGVGMNENYIPSLSAQIESQYVWDLGVWEARTRPAVFWSGEEGAGARLTQLVSYYWTDRRFVRSETRIEAWRDGGARDLSHAWTLYDQVTPTQGFSYRFSAQWDNRRDGWGLRAYGPDVRWRQRVYRDWLFLETGVFARPHPGESWKKAEKGVQIELEARFYAPESGP